MRPDGILRALQEAGYEVYYVGGCVRDRLLGRPCNDWDITTSALPEQVMALFARTVPTGVRHGTVTVLLDGEQAEVTTFRTEGIYSDSRHPEQVRFVRNLRDDLSRRDFTVNAMAQTPDGEIIDPFGGQDDLKAKRLRCVGDPEARFREDALRMLRLCRFAAQLGFTVDDAAWEALTVCAPLCGKLSRERVRDEVQKVLLSDRPEWLESMLKLGLLEVCGIQECTDLGWLRELSAEAEVRWAGLKVLLPELELRQLRLPGKLTALCESAAKAYRPERTELEWKQLIAAEGWETARLTAALCRSDAVEEIERRGDCVRLNQLAVTGSDFPALSGKEVGTALKRLLDYVLEHPAENNRERLLELADSFS